MKKSIQDMIDECMSLGFSKDRTRDYVFSLCVEYNDGRVVTLKSILTK